MTKKLTEEDKSLASEYALGVLSREEMIAVESRCEQDELFRREVEEWQDRLVPMLDEVPQKQPGQQVWNRISEAIDGAEPQTSGSRKENLWNSLRFWRGISFIGIATAIASLAVLVIILPSTWPVAPDRELIAVLSADQDKPTILVRYNSTSSVLDVQLDLEKPKTEEDRELWIIPSGGAPRSLGLLNDKSRAIIAVQKELRETVKAGSTLAISVEPKGGSPTGLPTGPVIASGILKFL